METTGTSFSIARATFDDAEGILNCLCAAFEPYRTQYTAAAYEDTVMTSDTVRQRIESMTVLVARNKTGLRWNDWCLGARTRGPHPRDGGCAVVAGRWRCQSPARVD
jgi:hypothetical protein